MNLEKEIEVMPREQLRELQGVRLAEAVSRAYNNVKTYRDKMESVGLLPGDIRGIDDISKLPFTTKADLRDGYPFGMLGAPINEIVRIHASSGTTGKQTVVGYTKRDLDIWTQCIARCMAWTGVSRDDLIHVAYGYGLFTGGLGAHYGGEAIGAATIPVSTGNTKRQIQLMTDFGSTVLMCTPSYALYLAEALDEAGKLDGLKLKTGIFGAEPWTENMRAQIEKRLSISAYDIYGLSEISGPGVACECEAKDGMHINEDHFFAETIDPDSGAPIESGEGELVFTCLTKEGMPLIRYRTRDLTLLKRDRCACGRTLVRMGKTTGRSDDMLIIRGVNVFPSQVESVLLSLPETAPHYLLIIDREDNLDILSVQVELNEGYFSDKVREMEAIERRITREIESTLGVSAKIHLVSPRSIARSEGKAIRVIDNRKYD